MADKYLNLTDLVAIRDWAKGLFAKDADLDALSDRVDDIISEGGEPNVIETVKVNGTALTPDAQKAVDVEAAQISGATVGADPEVSIQQGAGKQITFVTSERYSEGNLALVLRATSDGAAFDIVLPSEDEVLAMIPISTSQLENDGDGESSFATEAYVDENGGKIDTISVNGTQQTITDKNVNITVPTEVSDLTNDSGFQTAAEVAAAISAAVTSAYVYKGSVATVDDLPASGNTTGDVYDVQATGMNYAWTGTAWDALGTFVDTSAFWTSTTGQTNTLEAATVSEINAILNA